MSPQPVTRPVRIKRGLLTLLVLAALGFAAIMARSVLTDSDQLRVHLMDRFAQWTGGKMAITGPARISLFPRTRIEVSGVRVSALKRMPFLASIEVETLRAEFGVWSLLWGELRIGRLTLFKPEFHLAAPMAGGAGVAPAAREPALVAALRSAPFSRVTIDHGSILTRSEKGTETVRAIQANLALSRGGDISAEGVFKWRGETVAFTLESDAPTLIASTANSPVRISLAGDLFNAGIDGQATISDGIQLTGTLNLNLPNARKFSRWMGLAVPEGAGLGPFTASGGFNWIGKKIAFNNGTFALDGTRAIGALAVLFDKARPLIEGTLALQTLNLDQYLTRSEKGESTASTSHGQSLDLSFPLLQHFDVDVRLSATEFRASPFAAGQTALTLALKSGALVADFSILDLFGGRSAGRLEIDTAPARPRLRLSGTLNELAAQPCIEAFWADSPIQGGLNVEFDIAGAERSLVELLGNLSGTLALSMTAGVVNVDLAKVVAEAGKGDLRGWKAVQGNATSFDRLAVRFALDHSSARAESFEMRTGAAKITGTGSIDIASGELDWWLNLPKSPPAPDAGLEAIVAELTHSLHIQGPWSDPTFHLKRKRAAPGAPVNRRTARNQRSRAFLRCAIKAQAYTMPPSRGGHFPSLSHPGRPLT